MECDRPRRCTVPGIRTRGFIVASALAAAVLWPAVPASAGGGCHSSATEGTGDTVAMAMACFTPSVLQVDPGTEVRFVNKDEMTHNVSATGWGSDGDMGEGDSFKATFDEEGTFPYACMYHYGMTGAIVVGDGDGLASAIPIQTGSVVDSTPVSEESVASVVQPARSAVLGWTIAGAIGLILGVGLTGLLRRGRQED
jgi:plastocyanin